MLIDNHGRKVNYLRLAVTDRCNLRCFYCMPESGIDYVPKSELMSYEEMLRLSSILVAHGISKIRITGGEPFLRKELWSFLERLSDIEGLNDLHITTNGILTKPYISSFKSIGINSVNLSLDSLNAERFFNITRRDELDTVLDTLHSFLKEGIDTKLNCVVMDGKNTEDIHPFIELTKNYPLNVRFIEEMPFNGSDNLEHHLIWDYKRILEHIKQKYPQVISIPAEAQATALSYMVEGHKGRFGIIPAFSRTFCGSCNRLRITATGEMRTCLYGPQVLNVKSLMRDGQTDGRIAEYITEKIGERHKDGFQAAGSNADPKKLSESMSSIGG